MKKLILTGLLLFIFTLSFSQSNESKPELKIVSQVSISPGIIPSFNIGTGNTKVWNNGVRDVFAVFRGFSTFSGRYGLTLLGFHKKTNYFKNQARVGWFWITDFGVDFISMPPLDIYPYGNHDSDPLLLVLPTISGGGGYSWQIGDKQFLRISLDIGIKFYLLDLNVAYVF